MAETIRRNQRYYRVRLGSELESLSQNRDSRERRWSDRDWGTDQKTGGSDIHKERNVGIMR